MSDISSDFSSNKGIGLLLSNSNIVVQQRKKSGFPESSVDTPNRQFSNMLEQNKRELDKPNELAKVDSQRAKKSQQQNVSESKNTSESENRVKSESTTSERMSNEAPESTEKINESTPEELSKKEQSSTTNAANATNATNAKNEETSTEDENDVIVDNDGSVADLELEVINTEDFLASEQLVSVLNASEDIIGEESIAAAKQIIQESEAQDLDKTKKIVTEALGIKVVSEFAAESKLAAEKIEYKPSLMAAKVTAEVIATDGKKDKPIEFRTNPVVQAVSSEDAKQTLSEQNKYVNTDLVLARAKDSELPLEESTDNLFADVLKKLGENKSKFEFMLANNALERDRSVNGSKQRSSGELVEQLTAKLANLAPATDRASAISGFAGLKSGASTGTGLGVLNTSVNSPDWSNAFAKRIQMIVKKDVQIAELRLDPPELGRINIRISVTQDQASLAFSSQHASVRDAIDVAMPKLKEMLEESGLNLVNVDVSAQFSQQQGKEGDDDTSGLSSSFFSELSENHEENEQGGRQVVTDRLVDFFA